MAKIASMSVILSVHPEVVADGQEGFSWSVTVKTVLASD